MPKLTDPAVQLDVDRLILDFLSYSATKALLKSFHRLNARSDRSRASPQANNVLRLAGSFLSVFKDLHAEYGWDPRLQLRLWLLRLTALLTGWKQPRHHSPAPSKLKELRLRRRVFVDSFRENSAGGTGFIGPEMARSCSTAVEPSHKGLQPTGSTGEQQNFLPSISLLDTLPSFIALSAAHLALQDESSVTEIWMRLAAGYMAQAAAEQYLVYKSRWLDVLQKAFAWGFDDKSAAVEGTDEFMINAIFFDEEEEGANKAWEYIRDEHMRALVPPDGVSLEEHLRKLLDDELSISEFQERIFAFLEGLFRSQPIPILLQLQPDIKQGMSDREVHATFQSADLDYGYFT